MRRLLLSLKKIIEDIPSSGVLPDIPVNPEPDVNNKIFYTSTGSVITPYSTTAFGSTIVLNTLDSSKNMYVIEFNGDVTTCGSNAFRNRVGLVNIILPNTVTTIGDRAFYYCSSLSSINTGDNITSIGASAFSTCSLTNISFGPNLKSIGQYAFYGCDSLSKIYCKAETPPTGAYGMLEGIAETAKIYVPKNSVDAYKSAKYWSDYADFIEEYNFN